MALEGAVLPAINLTIGNKVTLRGIDSYRNDMVRKVPWRLGNFPLGTLGKELGIYWAFKE